MKKIFLVMILMFIVGVVYAGERIYVDSEKQLEVCDLSGSKSLTQINSEFKGNFKEVTAERKAKEEQNVILANEKKSQKENERKQKENKIKQKLNLSNQDWEDLKEALGA